MMWLWPHSIKNHYSRRWRFCFLWKKMYPCMGFVSPIHIDTHMWIKLHHGCLTSDTLETWWDILEGILHFCKHFFWKNNQFDVESILFTYCVIEIVRYLIMSFITFFCRSLYIVLCLGWYNTWRGSQGISWNEHAHANKQAYQPTHGLMGNVKKLGKSIILY